MARPLARACCITLHYIALHCIAMYCNTLHCILYNHVLIIVAGFETKTHVLNVGAQESVDTVSNGLTTFFPTREVVCPYAQVPRQLGARGALTVLRFAPLARLHPVLGFYA
jgi:hypothetical protein